MVDKNLIELIQKLIEISVAAGAGIMKVYSGDFDFELKADESPITAADRISHQIITEALVELTYNGERFPIISEEGEAVEYQERKNWDCFWMVDPLDGTKEFINRNGEFTVNIALIKGDKPILGIVYIPVDDLVYFGGAGIGSFRTEGEGGRPDNAESLPLKLEKDPKVLIAAGSRSHRSSNFDVWVKDEAEKRGCSKIKIVTAGSSLKFCLAAEGRIDVYPRFGPTMEWDTAAAQAVAEGAGRSCSTFDGRRLMYNKPVLKNEGFVVF